MARNVNTPEIPTSWEGFEHRYKLLMQNVISSLDATFKGKSPTQNDLKTEIDRIVMSRAVQSKIEALDKMRRQMNAPRGDDFTSEEQNLQMGAEVKEQDRPIPGWAEPMADSISDPRIRQGRQSNAQNRADPNNPSAENRNELTPQLKMRMMNAPKLTAALKKDVELQYTPKIKPQGPF